MTAAELHAILLASVRMTGDPIKSDLAKREPAVPLKNQQTKGLHQ